MKEEPFKGEPRRKQWIKSGVLLLQRRDSGKPRLSKYIFIFSFPILRNAMVHINGYNQDSQDSILISLPYQ
jgi:hypothetical protein